MPRKSLPSLPSFVAKDDEGKRYEIESPQEPVRKRIGVRKNGKKMDAFAYCSKFGKKNYKEYRKRYKLKTQDATGDLPGDYDVEFARKDVKDAIRVITKVLKVKGLTTPYLLLPFRPRQSDGLLRDFLKMIFKHDAETPGQALVDPEQIQKIARHQDELTLVAALKFFWCRLPGNAVIGWKTYTRYVKLEEEAGYPPRAFLEFMPSCLRSGAHASIVYDFFDLLVAIVMKSKQNHLAARRLAGICGLWAFHPARTRDSGVPSFERGLYEWIPAGDAVFHLLLSFIRSMPPQGESSRLPKILQRLLKIEGYPPMATEDRISDSSAWQDLPVVTLRVNRPSENPAQLLVRVSRTLQFDDPALYDTREEYLLLKRLFKDPKTVVKRLSPEGARILDNVCLYDEDLVSDGKSKHGNHIKFQLLAGWSLDLTADKGLRRKGKIDPKKADKGKTPDFFTADVSTTTLQDYFIWAWMASLGPEETNVKKKTFGKTYVMEAQLAEGFKKWVIVEEQDFQRDKYDVEIEIKKQKLKKLESEIRTAKRAVSLKQSPSISDLSHYAGLHPSREPLPVPPVPPKDYLNRSLPRTPSDMASADTHEGVCASRESWMPAPGRLESSTESSGVSSSSPGRSSRIRIYTESQDSSRTARSRKPPVQINYVPANSAGVSTAAAAAFSAAAPSSSMPSASAAPPSATSSSYYTAQTTLSPIRDRQPVLSPPASSSPERSPSPGSVRSKHTSKLMDDISDLEFQLQSVLSTDDEHAKQGQQSPRSEQSQPSRPSQPSFTQHSVPAQAAHYQTPQPSFQSQPLPAQPSQQYQHYQRSQPLHSLQMAPRGMSHLSPPPPGTSPYSSPSNSFTSTTSSPQLGGNSPIRDIPAGYSPRGNSPRGHSPRGYSRGSSPQGNFPRGNPRARAGPQVSPDRHMSFGGMPTHLQPQMPAQPTIPYRPAYSPSAGMGIPTFQQGYAPGMPMPNMNRPGIHARPPQPRVSPGREMPAMEPAREISPPRQVSPARQLSPPHASPGISPPRAPAQYGGPYMPQCTVSYPASGSSGSGNGSIVTPVSAPAGPTVSPGNRGAPAQGTPQSWSPNYYSPSPPAQRQSAPVSTNGAYTQGVINNLPPQGRFTKLHGVSPTNRLKARSALMNGDFGI